MKIFVAGATGAIGRPLVERLLAEGHAVVGMTRSERGAALLRALGAEPSVAEALDAAAVHEAIHGARPEVVIEQLTALPRRYTPETMRDAAELSGRVRTEGGGNVHAAALRAGARRYVAQSACFLYAPAPGLAGEDAPVAVGGPFLVAAHARVLVEVERRVLEATQMEGLVLRYGFLYGPGTWYAPDGDIADQVRKGQRPVIGDGRGVWSFVHVDDAVEATVAAVTRGDRGAYNVTDDQPTALATWLPAYARWLGAPEPPRRRLDEVADPAARFYAMELRGASNAKARRELGFRPRPLAWLAEAADQPSSAP